VFKGMADSGSYWLTVTASAIWQDTSDDTVQAEESLSGNATRAEVN